jgi:hypothetical protein
MSSLGNSGVVLAESASGDENAPVTMTEMHELLVLAEQAADAVDKAGSVSRVRAVDIQLIAAREKVTTLSARVREMVESEQESQAREAV